MRDGRSWKSDNSSGYRYVGHSEPSKEMGKLGGKRIKATPGIKGSCPQAGRTKIFIQIKLIQKKV